MNAIDEKIKYHYQNSKNLRYLYLNENKMSFDKGQELQKKQDEEFKKMMFFKNLRKEMFKKK